MLAYIYLINKHSQVVFITSKVFINLYKKTSNSNMISSLKATWPDRFTENELINIV